MEDRRKPAVVLINKDFLYDGKAAALSRGMPGVRIIPETVPPECSTPELIEAGVGAAMEDIVNALTKPLNEEERSPKPEIPEKLSRLVFKGNLEEINRFFYKRGWTDGLPIIPPTEEAIREMLTGTDLPPDQVVGKMIPRMGKATVEKIAINAVMAGALPTYMPILIAGVQALLDPKSEFGTFEVSTGSWTPFWIMNGPIRRDLNINCGSGALSPGDIANAAIGRAMSLIIRNIGGPRKGIEDMGTYGNTGKYTMVIAENEEESPWEPLQVEHGFNKIDSTVTLFFPNTAIQPMRFGTSPKDILNCVISNVVPGLRGLLCVLLNPENARILAGNEWTKKQIAAFISEYARRPAHQHPEFWGSVIQVPSKERLPLNPTDFMRLFWDPDWIRVVVAGGPGGWIGLFQGDYIEGTDWVTIKVELPKNWERLVAKYKNVVPSYVLKK